MADYEQLYLQEKQANHKLLVVVKQLKEQNAKLLQNVQTLGDIAKAERQKAVEAKFSKLLEINFNDFCNYLSIKYRVDSMPKTSGIYAYINHKRQLIYVGQSKNMGNRLKQHFRNGQIKINGHDCEFKSTGDWEFYVLEYIDKNDKKKLDEREAYWISLARVATTDKTVYDSKESAKYLQQINRDPYGVQTEPIAVKRTIPSEGSVINRTRGNNIRM